MLKYKDATSPRPSNRAGQVVETPNDLFRLVMAEFNITWDLAATKDNAKVANFITPEQDTFKVSWHELPGYLWLNPPFADVTPWVEKCAKEMELGAKIILLAQASVDSNWYRNWVEPYASMRWLSPRLVFVGHKNSFPKPMMLAVYDNSTSALAGQSYQWRWKP